MSLFPLLDIPCREHAVCQSCHDAWVNRYIYKNCADIQRSYLSFWLDLHGCFTPDCENFLPVKTAAVLENIEKGGKKVERVLSVS